MASRQLKLTIVSEYLYL